MASHFDTIGLRNYGMEELQNMFRKQIGNATFFDADGKAYARISMGAGLTYWLSFVMRDEKPCLIDFDFHFHSNYRNDVYFCNVMESDDESMDGMVRVHLIVEGVGTDLPLNLNVPMLAITGRMEAGNHYYAQIAGYAEAAHCWPSVEAYEASFPDSQHLRAEHLIPSGTFSPCNDPEFEQSPRALLGGIITGAQRGMNTITGNEYWHITVHSLGVDYDLLVAPEELNEEPVIGGVLHGSFWLTAMLYTKPDHKDYLEMECLPEGSEDRKESPEDEQDSACCFMTVTRPISNRILQRIRGILESLADHSYDFLVIDFDGRDSDREFIQAVVERIAEQTTYRVEYSCVEDGKQIIRTRRHQTLDETVEIMSRACSVTPDEFNFGLWLEIGWKEKEKEDRPETLPVRHYYPEIAYSKATKRYLTVSSGPSFADEIREPDRDDESSFRMVAEPDGTPLSASELDSVAAIVLHTAVMMHGCNIELDGMQLGICNDPDGELSWRRDDEHKGRYYISLCADTLDDWSQTIYQIGYAFTHCVIDYCCIPGRIPWLEETICEMMQIWLLNSFAEDWARVALCERDPAYPEHIREYLHDYMMDQEWTDAPSQCRSMDELLSMNQNAEENAADRVGTVIQLFYLTTPDALAGLLRYGFCELGNKTGLIDTKEWRQRNPDNLAVRYLAAIQDNAVRNDPDYQALLERIEEQLSDFWDRFYDDDWTEGE